MATSTKRLNHNGGGATVVTIATSNHAIAAAPSEPKVEATAARLKASEEIEAKWAAFQMGDRLVASIANEFPRSSNPAPSKTRDSSCEELTSKQQISAVSAVQMNARDKFAQQLCTVPFMSHNHALFMHGRGYVGPTGSPTCTWKSTKPPRDDHDAPSWLTASEYQDQSEGIPNIAIILLST
jgi:hypothetical protein